jgi:phage gpG-like protein
MARLSIKYKDETSDYLKLLDKRFSPKSLIHINENIIGRVVHSAVTYNFKVQGRPQKWAALKIIYAKIKSKLTTRFLGNLQPIQLGKYPTPWGNIGVKTGLLFNSLGTIFRVTSRMLTYGTTIPYASQFAEGHIEKGMQINYVSKTGKYVSYYKSFNVHVPGRHFLYVSPLENRAINRACWDYMTASAKATRIIISNIGHNILATGGRYVYILK